MAYHYSGNQFEWAYKPSVLRNWEVPKFYKHPPRPKTRTGSTRVIANDRGHILPGEPKSTENPWGDFIPTWHMPNKIDRKTANELNGLYKLKKPTCKERQKAEGEDASAVVILRQIEDEIENNQKQVVTASRVKAEAPRLGELEDAFQNETKCEASLPREQFDISSGEAKVNTTKYESEDDGAAEKEDRTRVSHVSKMTPRARTCPMYGVLRLLLRCC